MTDPQQIHYSTANLLDAAGGISSSDFDAVRDRLAAARHEILEVDLEQFRSGDFPAEKNPLDAGFIDLPTELLRQHEEHAQQSQLGRIQSVADALSARCDRIVVLGIGGSYMGARTLMEACCHPFHNELGRSKRNNRPRIYFGGNNVDNDATHGLLDLLASGSQDLDDWGIVVISKSGGTLETAAAFRQFLAALQDRCGGDRQQVAERVVPITGTSGKLSQLADAIGCPDRFPVPNGVGGRFSVLSAVGLLPAAIMGLDVSELLRGADAMLERFRHQPIGSNPALDFAGMGQCMDANRHTTVHVFSVWSSALEALGLWYDQLYAESLGKQEKGSTPLTVVNTRDLHSRAQQHQEGVRDKLFTNVVVHEPRSAALPIGPCSADHDQLDRISDKTLPELMQAALKGTTESYSDDARPSADIVLPKITEFHLGEVLQMLMLSTVVEGRMMGINPYGQPGVEGYKGHMGRALGLR